MMRHWPRPLQRLGVPGLLGLLCMVAALWAQQFKAPAQAERTELALQEADRLRAILRQASIQPPLGDQPATQRTPQAAWQDLWNSLPPASERRALQAQVWRHAQAVGMPLTSMQSQAQREAWVPIVTDGHGLWRQRMQFPVQAPYADLRAWVQALQQVPGLSIDGIDLQRADPRSDEVKAQIRLSLWWRGQEGAP